MSPVARRSQFKEWIGTTPISAAASHAGHAHACAPGAALNHVAATAVPSIHPAQAFTSPQPLVGKASHIDPTRMFESTHVSGPFQPCHR